MPTVAIAYFAEVLLEYLILYCSTLSYERLAGSGAKGQDRKGANEIAPLEIVVSREYPSDTDYLPHESSRRTPPV